MIILTSLYYIIKLQIMQNLLTTKVNNKQASISSCPSGRLSSRYIGRQDTKEHENNQVYIVDYETI